MVTNARASLELGPRFTRIDRGDVTWFSIFALVGSVAILHPFVALGCLAGAAALGFCGLVVVYVHRAGLELWQVLLLITLTGYMLFNYGFENLAIHVAGIPIIISYGLMYASLALAILARQHLMGRALKEPAILCLLALLFVTVFHLVLDVPRYGIWAIRDASMFLDGVFLLLGLIWATKRNSTVTLTKWLMIVFVLNMMYSFTLPWGEKLWSWSPQSGVFLEVPLLGTYRGNADLLASGAVFCICVGDYVVRRPRWMLILTMAQLLGLAIEQARRMYVGIAVVLIILVLLGEAKKFTRLLAMLSSGIVVVFLLTAVGGLEISGRIGPVNMSFFREHIRSISGAEGTPGSSVQSRFTMADQAMLHLRSHPALGEGFGQPLLTEDDENGAVTRMPHNSSLSILARLGVIGCIVWIAFHLCLLTRFVYAFRQRRCCDKRLYSFILWFLLFYVLFMIGSFVETPLEFPASAVPFYFLTGFALGLMRWQLRSTTSATKNWPCSEVALEKA
jgi:O-antigen ligase